MHDFDVRKNMKFSQLLPIIINISQYRFIQTLVNQNSFKQMTTYESYSTRYSKSKQKGIRSVSPIRKSRTDNNKNQVSRIDDVPANNQESAGQLGNIVSRLSDRIDGIQIKMTSITNIVKMLQKYTQTRDEQYQKQKQNKEFQQSIGMRVGSIQSLEIQNRLKQFQTLAYKIKSQMAAMESLRVGISRENSKKRTFQSPQQFDNKSMSCALSPNDTEVMSQIQSIVNQMQNNLREQMNSKIDICMSYFKAAIQQSTQSGVKSFDQAHFGSPTTVNSMNSTMLQQQMHNLTLTVNKIQSDCIRNKMVTDKKIEEIVSYVNEIRKQIARGRSRKDRQRSRSISVSKNSSTNIKQGRSIIDDNKSERSSKSKRSVSRKKNQQSKSQYNLQGSKITQQKKLKENQLKQALRKKKQNQQKLLKMKKIQR